MKNKKRLKSSDLNLSAFILSVDIGVLVGALFLCLNLLILSNTKFLIKYLTVKHLNIFYGLSFCLCGYISSFIFKRNSVLVSVVSFSVLMFLFYKTKGSVDFIMCLSFCLFGALIYEVFKKDVKSE